MRKSEPNVVSVDPWIGEMVLALFQDICLTETTKCLRCGRLFTFRRDETREIGQHYCPKCSNRENPNA